MRRALLASIGSSRSFVRVVYRRNSWQDAFREIAVSLHLQGRQASMKVSKTLTTKSKAALLLRGGNPEPRVMLWCLEQPFTMTTDAGITAPSEVHWDRTGCFRHPVRSVACRSQGWVFMQEPTVLERLQHPSAPALSPSLLSPCSSQ